MIDPAHYAPAVCGLCECVRGDAQEPCQCVECPECGCMVMHVDFRPVAPFPCGRCADDFDSLKESP